MSVGWDACDVCGARKLWAKWSSWPWQPWVLSIQQKILVLNFDWSKWTTLKAGPKYSGWTKPKWSVPFDVPTKISGFWVECKAPPVSGIHPGTISQQTSGAYLLDTVELRLTVTLVIQSPCYYRQFFLVWQKSHTFSNEKRLLIQSPINVAHGHILKSQAVASLQFHPINRATHQKFRKLECLWHCQFHWLSKLSLFFYDHSHLKCICGTIVADF